MTILAAVDDPHPPVSDPSRADGRQQGEEHLDVGRAVAVDPDDPEPRLDVDDGLASRPDESYDRVPETVALDDLLTLADQTRDGVAGLAAFPDLPTAGNQPDPAEARLGVDGGPAGGS